MPKLDKKQYTIDDLQDIVAALRNPRSGCPWDIKQTHDSLAQYLIEEVYEFIDTVSLDDDDDMREELGDILFQIIFHSQIAAEKHRFNLHDVIDGLCRKMIYRHPHVFGERSNEKWDEESVNILWKERKAQEQLLKKQADSSSLDHHPIDNVPSDRPALQYAHALGLEAAKEGFDWPNMEAVLDKISEEIVEIREAHQENLSEEIGDLLFASIQLCRTVGIDPEMTLRLAGHKFKRRFISMSQLSQTTSNDLEQWKKKWQTIKDLESQ